MAQVLRLRRMGSTNKPFYRIVATDERHPTNGRITENIGWYDPKKDEGNLSLDLERARYWQANGARVTETVRSLIRKAENMPPPAANEPPPVEETSETKQPDAGAAAEAAAPESAPAAETPSEEAPGDTEEKPSSGE